jgi:hypothetical protein
VAERVRIEIGFDAGQGISTLVESTAAEELERELETGRDGTYALESEDGRYVVVLRRVVYLKRFARDSKVGFGSTSL